MQLDKELCMKFPAVLREKLLNHEIELPDNTQIDYEKIFVYRAVARKESDNSKITPEDFKSYFELNKKFPNPNKKLAEGYVYKEGGPQETNLKEQHVCWWLYQDADVSRFKLREEERNG